MQIRAVFFDIDGTLVDSNEQHVTAWALAFRDEGYPQEADAIRAQIGKGGDLLVAALLPQAAQAVRKRIADGHGDYFKTAYLDLVHPFAGARELLKVIHDRDCKVALASSAKREEIDHYVALLDAGKFVDATVSVDDVAVSKPEPDIFAAALSGFGLPAEEVLAIGDTVYDIEAAGKAGIVTIGVTSGPYDAQTLKDAGAIAVYTDVAALLADLQHSPIMA